VKTPSFLLISISASASENLSFKKKLNRNSNQSVKIFTNVLFVFIFTTMNVESNFEKKKSLIFLKSSFWFYLKAENCIAYAMHISTVNCGIFVWRRTKT
jgi:hypothetical protein